MGWPEAGVAPDEPTERAPRGTLFGRTLALLLALVAAVLLIASAAVAWLWAVPGPWWRGVLALAAASAAVVALTALAARRLNRPLRELQWATSRVHEGRLESGLSELSQASEIRAVNRGFNRMARELARAEQDRAVMLAGISHDLRTPLARLRLEVELSVADAQARDHMARDIEQLDTIIDKFMDYARPTRLRLRPVLLAQLIDKVAADLRDPQTLQVVSRVAINQRVMADEVELGRVLTNVFENARRYARRADTDVATVTIGSERIDGTIVCRLRDDGPGVPREALQNLTLPFYRGDAARTEASGAGLGLTICEKAMARMNGALALAAAKPSGLEVRLTLAAAPDG